MSKKKVLIIDDAQVMRNIVINAIHENYEGEVEIFEADNGITALEVMEKHQVDLACVDWNMPGLDGLAFVKEVRKLKGFENLPLIMITSEAARYMIVDAVKAGVTDYIVKPIVGEKLWAKLKGHFR